MEMISDEESEVVAVGEAGPDTRPPPMLVPVPPLPMPANKVPPGHRKAHHRIVTTY